MRSNDIAIVGMSCIFPGAGDLHTFWQNIMNKVDSIQPVPADRIDPVFFSGGVPGADRFYCNRGGFIPEVEFDPSRFGILPLAVEGTEPDHLLSLSLAQQALEDAGIPAQSELLRRTAIIIGKGNYSGPGATRAIEIVRTGEQIVNVLRAVLPHLEEGELDQIKKEFQSRKGRFEPDTAMGLIPNLVASLVANRLNLGGAAYTLDAACASSLLAVHHAMQELNSERCDMVIAGGVHVGQNAAFWSIFNQLGALSKKGKITPFSEDADGLLIGEGCGFVVLKRLEDAVKDGSRIYAVLKGIGICSDGSGTSVMSPSVKGQVTAISEAWKNAGLEPSAIGYLEAHGTGTPLGDHIELDTLQQFFGPAGVLPKAGIGTVKSNIGHAMPASGMAGLIKTALALHHRIIPPTLHCDAPLPRFEQTRFKPVQEAQSWDDSGLARVAGVNAFGFGGINAHAVLEGYEPDKDQNNESSQTDQRDEVLLLAADTHEELLAALQSGGYVPGLPMPAAGQFRIAIFDPTAERIQKAIKIVTRNSSWRNKQDIWYSNTPLIRQGGKIAFVFPGLDGLAAAESGSVAAYFNLTADQLSTSEGLLNDALQVFQQSMMVDKALKKLGVLPDMAAGHSLGEWLACRSAGLVAEQSMMQLLRTLKPETYELKDSLFIAIGCGLPQLTAELQEISDLYLSNDNCPQQVILCGSQKALDQLVPLLRQRQIFYQLLPFQSGFHTPFLESRMETIMEGIRRLQLGKTSFPIWSATILAHYPEEEEAIMQLSMEHLIKPVRFRELTERLYAEGARVFIQVGAGGLTGFIDDTLKGQNISTVASASAIRPGIAQLQRVLAALFAEGAAVDPALLGYSDPVKPVARGIKLQLGLPLLTGFPELRELAAGRTVPLLKRAELRDTLHPLVQSFNQNLEEMADMQAELMQAFQHRLVKVVPDAHRLRKAFEKKLDITLENSPYLAHHCLMRQPPGWTCMEDMDPVIPMTMILEVFAETAAGACPQEQVQKIQNIRVFQWMNVTRAFRETISAEWKDQHLLKLSLERFAEAEVQIGPHTLHPPELQLHIGNQLPLQLSPAEIYSEHMFHGSAYQGIRELIAVGDKGIHGIIEGAGGKGSLLDNAGQLFGLWLQLCLPEDRIAFPVRIQEIAFYHEFQDQEGSFECIVTLTGLNEEFATADLVLKRGQQVWAVITGWQNRRMGIDERLWKASMAPLRNHLSEEIAPGIFMFHQAYNRVVSWGFVLKRYFSKAERAYYDDLLLHRKKEWMISRIAVKDAVKNLLISVKGESCYPIEFETRSDEMHRPCLHGAMTAGIHISLAHKGTDAVAIARYNGPVGIDMERIEERSEGFYDLVFSAAERRLLSGHPIDEWATRFWVAKEAYGKYLGKGLQGNPKSYIIEEIRGEELRIGNIFIKTIKHKNYIIGWTQS